jgi:hypothetical protein
MRVRSELSGAEYEAKDQPILWVEDGRLPRNATATEAQVYGVEARLGPAPGQAAWSRRRTGDAWEPVSLLDDGQGVDESLNPGRVASVTAKQVAALSTDEARWAALQEARDDEDLLNVLDSPETHVRLLLRWAHSPALFSTWSRANGAEVDEADGVSLKRW